MGTKNNQAKQYAMNVAVNAVIIFVSYLLAVVIRYNLFQPDISIDALSAPFLIIAGIYSVLMAFALDYNDIQREMQGNEVFTGIYQIISKNAIGCLVLAAVFFVTGIINFSRWALFLLWLISSLGLTVRQIVIYSTKARKRCSGEDPHRVVIIGEGAPAQAYIKAIEHNPQFGMQIVGYFGESDAMATDLSRWFEAEKYPFPVVRWLGAYSAGAVLGMAAQVDEVVIADTAAVTDLKGLIDGMCSRGVKVSFSLPYAACVNNGTKVSDLGETKLIQARAQAQALNYPKVGLVISVALLLIILLMKKYNLSSMNPVYTMAGIEKIRSLVFALFGFFLFSLVSNKLGARRHSLVNSALITLGVSLAFICVYELIYSDVFWISVAMDFLPTLVVVLIIWGIKEMFKLLSQSYIGV